eukprot:TRINITY_DN8925_c0_g1_i1.p1 TRINITY_DN8925_c0_g1~~TRINITY_DN8925_c0_g1_i1.p1  ORF type:complete len:256 (-),score=102.22 TRINITY_DN8925_c0_g1_i1:7-663(-)
MKTFLLLACTLLSVAVIVSATPKGFTYPDRYSALVEGWVADAPLLNRKTYSTGWMYTDYLRSPPAMRVDEVWNVTSMAGTPFWDTGVRSDTHLWWDTASWFFYSSGSSFNCSIFPDYSFLPSLKLIPQNTFSTGYAGTTYFEGHEVQVFNGSFGGIKMYTTMGNNPRPVALFYPPHRPEAPKRFWSGSVIKFLKFQTQLSAFEFDSYLFNPPTGCPLA